MSTFDVMAGYGVCNMLQVPEGLKNRLGYTEVGREFPAMWVWAAFSLVLLAVVCFIYFFGLPLLLW